MKPTLKRKQQYNSNRLAKPGDLTASQLRYLQAQLTIIDVRSQLEYLAGHIPGAHYMNRQRILQKVSREQPIAITCMSGQRSAPVAKWLVEQGYQSVYNLQGGLIAWRMERYRIQRGPRP